MRVVVVGCGRVGAGLATRLDLNGHDVRVIDRDPEAFTRLGSTFAGSTGAIVLKKTGVQFKNIDRSAEPRRRGHLRHRRDDGWLSVAGRPLS